MADVKLNSLATKTNANAAAILVKDSATQNQGAEGWITKAQLNQIIRDEIKAQMSAITSGSPDVPVLDGNTLKYMTLADFVRVVGTQGYAKSTLGAGESLRIGGFDTSYGFYSVVSLGTSYSCIVQLKWQKITIYNEASDITKDLTIAMDGNLAFTITNNRSVNTTVVVRRV